MRARYPDEEGYVERGGVRTFYEVYGSGDPTVLFLPAWAILHSRMWKSQIPYFARYQRIVTFDPRGNGKSDRPPDPAAYADTEYVEDALAVMDVTGTERAILVGLSFGGWLAARLAVDHPNRILAVALIGPAIPVGQSLPGRKRYSFDDVLETEEGWAKYNRHYWRKDYRGFVEFFIGEMFPEPHSTKQIEDGVTWGLETTADVLTATRDAPSLQRSLMDRPDEAAEFCRRIRCPVMVIHGDQDRQVSYTRGVETARLTGGEVVIIHGAGHHPPSREPVKTNLLLRAFIDRLYGPWSNLGRNIGIAGM